MSSINALLQEGLLVIAAVGGPMFAVLFGLGLVVGVLQAATQVNDPSVGTVPKLLAAAMVCVGLGGWMVERLASFVRLSFEHMAQGG